jgi:hypothetical protein
MELERAHVSVVAAYAAATASLPDQDLFQPSPPSGYGLRPATEATVDASGLQPEFGRAVARTLHGQAVGADATDAAGVLPASAVRAELVLAEPVTHRGLTQTEARRDLAGREAFGHESRQRVSIDASLGRVTVAVNRRQAVPLHPVADGRRMTSGECRDLLERKPSPQIGLKNSRVHDPNTSSGIGRNGYASSAVPASRSAPPELFSIARVFDSIWRTRSRVTPTSWPMSSSVIGPLSPSP